MHKRYQFRFEPFWFDREDVCSVVSRGWATELPPWLPAADAFASRLQALQITLQHWNRFVVGSLESHLRSISYSF